MMMCTYIFFLILEVRVHCMKSFNILFKFKLLKYHNFIKSEKIDNHFTNAIQKHFYSIANNRLLRNHSQKYKFEILIKWFIFEPY